MKSRFVNDKYVFEVFVSVQTEAIGNFEHKETGEDIHEKYLGIAGELENMVTV